MKDQFSSSAKRLISLITLQGWSFTLFVRCSCPKGIVPLPGQQHAKPHVCYEATSWYGWNTIRRHQISLNHHSCRMKCPTTKWQFQMLWHTPWICFNGTQTWRFGRWCSFSMRRFLGSMPNFPGCITKKSVETTEENTSQKPLMGGLIPKNLMGLTTDINHRFILTFQHGDILRERCQYRVQYLIFVLNPQLIWMKILLYFDVIKQKIYPKNTPWKAKMTLEKLHFRLGNTSSSFFWWMFQLVILVFGARGGPRLSCTTGDQPGDGAPPIKLAPQIPAWDGRHLDLVNLWPWRRRPGKSRPHRVSRANLSGYMTFLGFPNFFWWKSWQNLSSSDI